MKVLVTTASDEFFSLDVNEDLELHNFKAFCEVQSNIPSTEALIFFKGVLLTDDEKSIGGHGIRDGDIVVLMRITSGKHSSSSSSSSLPMFDFSQIKVPGGSGGGSSSKRKSASSSSPAKLTSAFDATPQDDPAMIRELFLANPDQLAVLKQNNPRLADVLLSGDLAKFAAVLGEQNKIRSERQQQRIRMLASDPLDLNAQRMIAEEIKQNNIEANMEAAFEYNPESFGTVLMLYVNCKVNGHPVKAFIDSGAQMTIMSSACAERCHVMHLVDKRWSGIAKGVGTQKIMGRIHMVQIQIESDFLSTSFSVLEEQPMDMLLGLDMLKRHQCVIDMNKNILRIGTTGTETPFLNEGDLPECARLSSVNEEEVIRQSERELEDQALAKAIEQSQRDSGSQPVPSSEIPQGVGGGNVQQPRMNEGGDPAPAAVNEADVEKIVQMGFTRQQAVAELALFNGNVESAVASLLAKSLHL